MSDTITEQSTRRNNQICEQAINERQCRPTQLERLRNLFERNEGIWLPLYRITQLGIAMYPPRLSELRNDKHRPMNITNKIEIVDGVKHSFYKYVQDEKSGQQRLGI
jgi:hypothetical protein